MPKVWTHRKPCRLCNSRNVLPLFKFAFTPPAACFVRPDGSAGCVEKIPLIVSRCGQCGLLQMLDVVDPGILFREDVHASMVTSTMARYVETLADELLSEGRIRKGDLVVDIGCGDGSLLRALKKRGMRVAGIDPSAASANQAAKDDIPHQRDFFTPAVANTVLKEHGPATLVIAQHTLGSIDNLHAVMAGIRYLLKQDGLFIFEEPALADLLAGNRFDAVHHDRLTFLTAATMDPFLRSTHMHLIEARRTDHRGGTFRGYVQRSDGPHVAAATLKPYADGERAAGIYNVDKLNEFVSRVEAVKRQVQALVTKQLEKGRKVAGYGASARTVTFIHECGWTAEQIAFVVDDNPLKQGLLIPGTDIPVYGPSALKEKKPDLILLFAGHHAEVILKQHDAYRQSGVTFLGLLPTPAPA